MLTILRGRNTYFVVLAVVLMVLITGFQNCASPKDNQSVTDTEDGIVHKIELDPSAGVLSVFDAGLASTEQGQNLLRALPADRPLVVLIRNGILYPGVQLKINHHSFLVSEYLNLLKIFSAENPSVPVFYSPSADGEITEDSNLEALKEISLEFGNSQDASKYCESILNLGRDAREGDLVIQIADAESLLSGNAHSVLKVYWTLPLRVFSKASCNVR